MTIYATHGVVTNAVRERFSHRNLLDIDKFADHLRRRPQPYLPLAIALEQGGDSLTIDDATEAAGNAAGLARQLGHDVTLFVNGYNISNRQPYFFSRLNVALDETKLEKLSYQNEEFDLQSYGGKCRFRSAVKARLTRMGSETDRQNIVTEICYRLDVRDIVIPSYLHPLTETGVRDLLSIGVDIQNHGWSHSPIGSMTAEAHADDIRRGRQWLKVSFGVDAHHYAVPNGDGLPYWTTSPHYRTWLLLDEDFGRDRSFSPGVFPRSTLNLP